MTTNHVVISVFLKTALQLTGIIPKLFSAKRSKLKSLERTPLLSGSLQVLRELSLVVSDFEFCQHK